MRRLTLVLTAIDVVLRRLSTLEPSLDVDELRTRAEACREHVQRWRKVQPTVEEGEKVMKRVLRLHVDVAQLERPATER
jgi:hypothetical protein